MKGVRNSGSYPPFPVNDYMLLAVIKPKTEGMSDFRSFTITDQ